MALTPRARRVRVECVDEKGEAKVIEASGWYARILQHEIDHLGGNDVRGPYVSAHADDGGELYPALERQDAAGTAKSTTRNGKTTIDNIVLDHRNADHLHFPFKKPLKETT